MNKNELVSTLISQHRKLQADLQMALSETVSAKSEGIKIFEHLSKFKADLNEHLSLENNDFYPQYLNIKKERGEETASIHKFIDDMMEIGKKVEAFLTKYNNPENISKELPLFSLDLVAIVKTLNVRIEVEEEGLYNIFLITA